MKEKIVKTSVVKEEAVKENITNFKDLIESATDADGYMLGVTLLKEGTLNHYLFNKTFPFTDMLKSHSKIKDLIVRQLEEDPRVSL
jgi:hypothetical protein